MTRRMIVIAVALAAAAAVAATFLPLVATDTVSSSSIRGETIEHTVAVQGSYAWDTWTLFLIWAPVAVAAVPLLRGSRRFTAVITVAAAVLLSLFVVVAGFSVGLLYAPAAVAMLIAAARALKLPTERSMA